MLYKKEEDNLLKQSKVKTLFKIIFIILIFVCINYTNGTNRKVTIFEEIVSNLITLPQRLIVNIKNYVSDNNNQYFSDVKALKEENEKIKEENIALKEKMINYEAVVSENEVLKSHIKLSNLYPNYSVIVADIIMGSVSNWEYTYVINRGSSEGIEPNMAVISEDGLVGYIESVTNHTAKIVSILDAGNAVSARVTRTRDTVISKGSITLAKDKQMRITNIPIGVTLVEGDKIETSGMGGIYPKGILIGKIKTFEQKENPVENEAIVESYVDFGRLETVAIITNMQGE